MRRNLFSLALVTDQIDHTWTGRFLKAATASTNVILQAHQAVSARISNFTATLALQPTWHAMRGGYANSTAVYLKACLTRPSICRQKPAFSDLHFMLSAPFFEHFLETTACIF
jgi:hypothetical protein